MNFSFNFFFENDTANEADDTAKDTVKDGDKVINALSHNERLVLECITQKKDSPAQ